MVSWSVGTRPVDGDDSHSKLPERREFRKALGLIFHEGKGYELEENDCEVSEVPDVKEDNGENPNVGGPDEECVNKVGQLGEVHKDGYT